MGGYRAYGSLHSLRCRHNSVSGDAMKSLAEVTDAEGEQRIAELRAEYDESRPAAKEADIVPMFRPGAIAFLDSGDGVARYGGVSPDIETVWPLAERWVEWFFDLTPAKHRVEYWRERIECGATILTTFFETESWQTIGAGIINCELTDDGEKTVFAPVLALRPLDLTDLSRIAESVALLSGAQTVNLWMAEPCPLVPGYRVERCWFGQLQAAPVRPIQ
jgi:hypothetical protein